MPLHHAEFTDRLVPHGELNPGEKKRRIQRQAYISPLCCWWLIWPMQTDAKEAKEWLKPWHRVLIGIYWPACLQIWTQPWREEQKQIRDRHTFKVSNSELNPEEKNRSKLEIDIDLTHSCLNIGRVECLSTMWNLLTDLSPTVNSTLKRRTERHQGQSSVQQNHLSLCKWIRQKTAIEQAEQDPNYLPCSVCNVLGRILTM